MQRALKCIFIDYPEGVKGLKVWNLESKGPRCFNTRDVVFNESKIGYTSKETDPTNENSGNNNSQFEVELREENLSKKNAHKRVI